MKTKNGYTDIANSKEVKELVDHLTMQHAQLIEKDVLELTGILKAPNERYYKYLKRAVQEKFTEYKDEINRLTAIIEDGTN